MICPRTEKSPGPTEHMNGKDWEVKRPKLEKSKNADYWIPKIERDMKRDLDKKTCPEESLIQIGTMEKSVSPAVLAEIAPQQEKALEALGIENRNMAEGPILKNRIIS